MFLLRFYFFFQNSAATQFVERQRTLKADFDGNNVNRRKSCSQTLNSALRVTL